ncbi:Uncharacterized protein FWK35_00037150, partial [Aphis craccivora]
MAEQDEYSSKGSGYTLQCIDGLLLGVYNYTPMSASSYIPLPDFIEKKKAIINPQNSDQQCFKWAILAKHVSGNNKNQVAENYITHEEKYNFSGLTFPTKLHQNSMHGKKTQRHPIVIYADFEALLRKSDEKCGNNTKAIQKHEAMSYGFMVKANNDVSAELLEKFNIPTSPIIFRGDEDNQNVGEHFVKSIVDIAENIEKLLQTNIPITFTAEQQQEHN